MPARRRHFALAILVVAFTLSHVDRQIVAILAEPLRHEFSLTDTQLGLLTGLAFAVFYSTLSLPVASWADRTNRNTIISTSLFLWSSMTVLCGSAASFVHLLLGRIGVGIGEAGASAPSQSLIADLYPRRHRSLAMAIFGSGVNVGILLAFGVGGWVSQAYGWRWAFVAAGVPGMVLAAFVKLTLPEPRPRPTSDENTGQGFFEVARAISRSVVVRNSMAGALLASTAGYATIAWLPSFMVRYHGMSTGTVGLMLGLQIGVLGAIGAVSGGYLADRLAHQRSEGWRGRILAIGFLLYVPFGATAYLATDPLVSVICLSGPALLSTIHVGINFSILQTYMPPRMRARTAAINLFVVNLFALGGGPLWVGIVSDRLADQGIEEGLRWALVSVLLIVGLASVQFFRLGRILDRHSEIDGQPS